MRMPVQRCCGWILGLCIILAPALTAATSPVQAGSATLAVTPTSNLPHGAETISGSGFDPQATVAISVTSSTGTVQVGTFTADTTGAIAGTVTLPLSLDATAPNTITAQETGGSATASTTLIGLPVIPAVGSGQQITGRVGEMVLVHAIGFAPLDPLTVTIGGAPVTLPMTMTNALVSAADGEVNLLLTVPAGAQPGAGQIVVTGSVTGLGQNDRATLPINIVGTQSLVATPNPAPAGRTVALAGSGFSPDEAISITLSYTDTVANAPAVAAASAHASDSGNLDLRFGIPPTAQPGSNGLLVARGERSGLSLSLSVSILGQPAVGVTPAVPQPGGRLAIAGSGFEPNERLYIATPLFTPPSSGFIADATGSFSATVTLHTRLAGGVYYLSVSGTNGEQATARLSIPAAQIPTLRLVPAQVMPGDDLHVQGARFLASESVQLRLGNTLIMPATGPITATATGVFSTTVRVPSTPASGVYTVTAEGLATGAKGAAPLLVRLPIISRTYFAEGYTGQGPQIRYGETLDLLNTNAITASGRIEYFLSSGITSTVALTIPAKTQLSEDVVHDVGPDKMVSALVELDQNVAVTRTISRTTVAGGQLGESISNGVRDLSQFWYFAEGYTGVTFQEYLSLFNPSGSPAAVVVQPESTSGSSPLAPIKRTVAPHSRLTINLRAALPNRAIGLVVQADQSVAAERTLYWGTGAGSGKFGTSVNSGQRGPAALWTFPYASTSSGDQAFLAFTNPTTVAAHVRLALYADTGLLPTPQMVIVEPGSRATITLPSRSGAHANPVGIVASSDVPVIAEQAQYFGGSPNIGQHTGTIVAGASQPASRWLFPGFNADHYTNESWYILNTGSQEAQLTATLYTMQAQPAKVSFRAAAGRLTSVSVQNVHELLSGSPSIWSSTVPVVIVQVLHSSEPSTGAIITAASYDGH